MLILIDESGCPGFKEKSSQYFLLGMIIFDSFADAEKASKLIEEIKPLNKYKKEFKFSDCNFEIRDIFFTAIKKANFRIRLIVVNKSLVTSQHLKDHHKNFYNFFLKQLLKNCDFIQDANIKIDGNGSREFKRACQAYLRRELPDSKIKKLNFKDSKSDNLIQLADMVISAIARPYNSNDKKEPSRWYDKIRNKIDDCWLFR